MLLVAEQWNQPKKPVVSIAEREAIEAQAEAEDAEKDATASRGQIERGMNREQCKTAWGEPTSVKRFRTGAGIEEIWIYQYGLHHGFMLTFTNGVLKDVRSPHSD